MADRDEKLGFWGSLFRTKSLAQNVAKHVRIDRILPTTTIY